MNKESLITSQDSFAHLHPDDVLNLIEKSLDREFSNLFRTLNSYINRVFELEDRNGHGIVVKFYRPGRWQKETILDEHRYLQDLQKHEVPVICPMQLKNDETLGTWNNIYFAVFPKCGGRSIDEFNDDQWQELGRLIGRAHAIGSTQAAANREKMLPSHTTANQIEYLRENHLVAEELQEPFFAVASQLIEEIKPYFADIEIQRIHGDLHFSNIIYRPGESFYLIDFDDMVMGPQIQDIWMLLQNYGEDSFIELDLFLEGYETFHHFDRRNCRLIEPLRAMRYIHYLAWCGYQVVNDGKTLALPEFGSSSFWQTEIGELEDQITRIREFQNPFEMI